MKGGRVTVKEKLCIALLGFCLWIELIVLGLAIGLDLWVTTPSIESMGEESSWMIGLWKACLCPANAENFKIYSLNNDNCTDISNWDVLHTHSLSGGWSLGLQLLSLVFISISAFMTILAHLFYVCGYIPRVCCKTFGMGGLPSVLITSGISQVCTLVTIYFMDSQVGSFGLSYYLTAANLLPTWITAIATLVVTCRID